MPYARTAGAAQGALHSGQPAVLVPTKHAGGRPKKACALSTISTASRPKDATRIGHLRTRLGCSNRCSGRPSAGIRHFEATRFQLARSVSKVGAWAPRSRRPPPASSRGPQWPSPSAPVNPRPPSARPARERRGFPNRAPKTCQPARSSSSSSPATGGTENEIFGDRASFLEGGDGRCGGVTERPLLSPSRATCSTTSDQS